MMNSLMDGKNERNECGQRDSHTARVVFIMRNAQSFDALTPSNAPGEKRMDTSHRTLLNDVSCAHIAF